MAVPTVVPDYYVATNGNDTTGDGSAAAPWATIGKAASSISGGDIVLVQPGTYSERVTIAATKAGTSGSETQFVSNGIGVVVTGGFEVNADYTILDGFEVTPGSTSIANVDYRGQVYVRAAHVTLKNLNVHETTYAAAVCLSCSSGTGYGVADYAAIEDCTFANLPWNAVSVDNGSSGTHAADVSVTGCTISRFGGHQAIKAYGDRWTIEDTVIEGPRLTDFQQTSVYDGDGISVNYGDGTIIRRCRIYDIWSYKGYASGEHADCIQFWDSVTDLTIDSCVLGSWKPGGYDNSPGATNAIMYGTCTTNCDVTVQNCVLLCGITAGPSAAANAHLGAAAANTGSTVTIRLYNNTFYGNYPYNNGSNTTLVSRNNVFYSHRGSVTSGDDSDYNAFMWNQWSDASYTGLQNSTVWASEGAHSIGLTEGAKLLSNTFVDPDVSAGSDYGLSANFSPRTGSPLLGAGDPAYAPTLDIRGNLRSATAPTIGAYEVGYNNAAVHGEGALTIGAVNLSGIGFLSGGGISGGGQLRAAPVSMEGSGLVLVDGTGALTIAPVALEGTGSMSTRAGALTTATVALFGVGHVIPRASLIGVGTLRAGAAQVEGTGSVWYTGIGRLGVAPVRMVGYGTVFVPYVTGAGSMTIAAVRVTALGTVPKPGADSIISLRQRTRANADDIIHGRGVRRATADDIIAGR